MQEASEQPEISGESLSSARRGVLASHFERVFSWTDSMQRLDWKLDHDGSINAQHEGWAFEIVFQPQQNMWQLCIEPTPDRGPDWRNWYLTAYLQDAMAIAQAIASGANLS